MKLCRSGFRPGARGNQAKGGLMSKRWSRRRRGLWRRLLTLENALIALATAILALLAVMAEVGVP